MTDRVDCQYDKPIPFINDHDALAELFRQIRLGARQLPDVERLNHPEEYSQMAQMGFSVSDVDVLFDSFPGSDRHCTRVW